MNRDHNVKRPSVVVIDDDKSVREALRGLFESVGLATETYGSVQDFRASDHPEQAGCLVVDIRLPGESGLEFQESLARNGSPRSVVLISAHADVPMSVRAMRAGAIDVLTKPVREQDLLEAVYRGIAEDGARRIEASSRAGVEARYAALTDRERQIMGLVVTGMQNKQIAAELCITEATVKLHRGNVMRKMEAHSLAALVRMADIRT
ncbi:response regulator transcription factor [Mesorhizobium loti]|uniref:DNA-binding response regulator n=1 Tax=Mesorhizobium loti R88b TaxID=935548 RepID=A0A6M7WT17_RHILI|nr:response regulator [Mesorhizobium loti]QKD05362.1 DNA-binding response regulator [Mesorhizobium loti R88b]